MSDDKDVELIAIAQVNAFAGPPAGIEFNSNSGFKKDDATRVSAGAYVLELNNKHDAKKLVINVTRNSGAYGAIQAGIVGTGDVNQITINNFDPATGLGSDTPFFITVWRVRD